MKYFASFISILLLSGCGRAEGVLTIPALADSFLPADVALGALDAVINSLDGAEIKSIDTLENTPGEIKLQVDVSDQNLLFTLKPDGAKWRIVGLS